MNTHSKNRVRDSQPDGANQWGDIGEGQQSKDRHREDTTDGRKNAPQTNAILKPIKHKVVYKVFFHI